MLIGMVVRPLGVAEVGGRHPQERLEARTLCSLGIAVPESKHTVLDGDGLGRLRPGCFSQGRRGRGHCA